MFKSISVILASLVLLQDCAFGQQPTVPKIVAQGLSDQQVRDLLVKIVDPHPGAGIVVGIIGPSGSRIYSRGAFDKSVPRPVDGDTEFQINSITKVFVSLVLADMVRNGEVSLDDPVAKFLPKDVRVPTRGGKQITLADLATHTSGLPLWPPNFEWRNLTDYRTDQLYAFLTHYQLKHDPGTFYEYSNVGTGLLGLALSARAGESLETLIRERVTAPLGLSDTTSTLDSDQQMRLAPGHNERLKRVPEDRFGDVFKGAGELRSTTNDMMKLLAIALGHASGPIEDDMKLMLSVNRPAVGGASQGLGWGVTHERGGLLVNKAGGSPGYLSYIAYMPDIGAGVVVLTNGPLAGDVDDLGDYILGGIDEWP